jgi:hypothetical protein
MRKELTRLALLQMVFIFYSILGVGVLLKVRYGSPAPADLFATHVRDYGYLLLLLPAAWCICAVCEQGKPVSDHRTGIALFATGLVLTGFLLVIAFCATMSAVVLHQPLIYHEPPPAPSVGIQIHNEP